LKMQFEQSSDRILIKNLDTGEMISFDDIPAPKIDKESFQSANLNFGDNPSVSKPSSSNNSNNSNNSNQIFSPASADSAFHAPENRCQVDKGTGLNFGTFLVSEEKIAGLLVNWLSTLWFAPGKVTEKVSVSDVKKYYIPYYLFYATTHSQYSASVCTVREDIINNQRVRNETWIQSKGVLKTLYKEIILLGASDPIDRSYAKEYEKGDWDLSRINYEDSLPGYIKALANDASTKQVLKSWVSKLEKSFEGSDARVRPSEDQLLPYRESDVVFAKYEKSQIRQKEKAAATEALLTRHKAERVKDLILLLDYSDKLERKLYLPVYICTFIYNAKTYKFWVNGHSEKVVGERPYGAGKIGELSSKGVKLVGAMITNSDKVV